MNWAINSLTWVVNQSSKTLRKPQARQARIRQAGVRQARACIIHSSMQWSWSSCGQISFFSNLWPFMTFSRMNTRFTSLFLIYDHCIHPVINIVNIEWYKWCVCSLYGALGVYKPVYISIETFYIDLLTILCFKQSFKKYFRIDISIIQFHPDKTKKFCFIRPDETRL